MHGSPLTQGAAIETLDHGAQPPADDHDLAAHVLAGLSASQKFLSSRFFYDDEGSRLFQRIMALPEYYLTRTEHAILQSHGSALAKHVLGDAEGADVVELGSGDGEKTLTLCAALADECAACVYHPVDVSALALEDLSARFADRLPQLTVVPLCGDYSRVWPRRTSPAGRHVVLFLGSNLGNYREAEAIALLSRIRNQLREGDVLVLGLDLKKDPTIVRAAYDDAAGITAQFNLNLLRRLNRELDARFVLDQFHHYATYDPMSGAAHSFLVSRCSQDVWCGALQRTFTFGSGETIHMELSQKYDSASVERLAVASGFEVSRHFCDANRWYTVVVWRARLRVAAATSDAPE